ncbi:MAG: hypothetical protein R3F43_27025 [bacterium]
MNIGCTFLLALGTLAGCGGPAARAPATHGPPLPGARTLRVVAFVDPSAARIAGHAERLGERLASASDHLAAVVALRLELVAVRTDPAPAGDLAAALERLERERPAPEADLVVLYTADAPTGRPKTADLVQSRYAGRSLVLRSPATLIPPDDPERLHRAEVELLEHGIATLFGALPGCQASLMASSPPLGRLPPTGFLPLDVQLMRAHQRLDLRGGPRVPVGHGPRRPGHPAGRAARSLPGGHLRASPGPAGRGIGPTAPAGPAPVERGVAALAAGRPADAWAACEAIAGRPRPARPPGLRRHGRRRPRPRGRGRALPAGPVAGHPDRRRGAADPGAGGRSWGRRRRGAGPADRLRRRPPRALAGPHQPGGRPCPAGRPAPPDPVVAVLDRDPQNADAQDLLRQLRADERPAPTRDARLGQHRRHVGRGGLQRR